MKVVFEMWGHQAGSDRQFQPWPTGSITLSGSDHLLPSLPANCQIPRGS